MTWTPGDVSGSMTLTDADHLFASHINELRTAVSAIPSTAVWFNAKQYGAVGDGVANDTGAIQATLTAAQAVGGVCYLPEGIYAHNGTISKNGGNVTIIGAGMGKTVLKQTSNSLNTFNIGNATGPLRNNIRIEGMTIDLNGKTGNYGLMLSFCSKVVLKSLEFKGNASSSYAFIYVGLFNNPNDGSFPAEDITLEDIHTDSGEINQPWEAVTLGYAKNVKVRASSFMNKKGSVCLLNYGSEGVDIEGNYFRGAGITVSGRGPTFIRGNTLEGGSININIADNVIIGKNGFKKHPTDPNHTTGIQINGQYFAVGAVGETPYYLTLPYTWSCKNITIDDNDFQYADANAINALPTTTANGPVLAAYDLTISNNKWSYSNWNGIHVYAKYLTVTGNMAYNNAQTSNGSTSQNFTMGAAYGIFDNNQSYDDQATPTITKDVVLNNQYPALLPTQDWKIGQNHLLVAGVLYYYSGGSYSTTKPSAITISRYVLADGAAGGQTVIGDTAASGNLNLQSTAHATRGAVNALDKFIAQKGMTVSGGDDQANYANSSIVLGYMGTTNYPHFIHTRHNGGALPNNAIDLYTSDGTASGTFPTNAVHGLSINNGKVGINGRTNPQFNLDVAGTIRSQLIDEGGQVYNVQAWGAVGDGVTDNTTALQAVYIAAAGRTVYYPPGTYVSGPLKKYSNTRSLGAGRTSSILKLKAGSNAYLFTTYDTVPSGQTYPKGHIWDSLGFDGNRANNTTLAGFINCPKGDRPMILNCAWQNYNNRAVYFAGTGSSVIQPIIKNCMSDFGDRTNGVSIFTDYGCTDGEFDTLDLGRAWRGLVHAQGGDGNHTMFSVWTWGNADCGIQNYQSHYNHYIGCTVDQNFGDGMVVDGSVAVSITGATKFSNNSFVDSTNQFGFGVIGTSNVSSGIRVVNASRVRLSAPIFANPNGGQKYGIQAESSSQVFYNNADFSGMVTGNTNTITSATITNLDYPTPTVVTVSAAYAVTATDSTILGDASSGAFAATLPTAAGRAGKTYIAKKMDSTANAFTLATTGGETIDGLTTKAITTQYNSYMVQSNGTNWVIV